MDPSLGQTRCPCWPASTANQSGLLTLIFDLLTLKVISESRETLETFVPILVFLGLSVLDLGPMCATNRRQTDVRRASSLTASALWGGGIIIDKRTEVPIPVFGKKLHDIYMMSIFRASLHGNRFVVFLLPRAVMRFRYESVDMP